MMHVYTTACHTFQTLLAYLIFSSPRKYPLLFHFVSLARQASAGRLMLCFCYFLSSFLTIAWSKEISEYKTDLHQIFRHGKHVGVDVNSGIGFAIAQGMLPTQPLLSAKSAEIGDTPSSGTDIPQRMAEWESGWAR